MAWTDLNPFTANSKITAAMMELFRGNFKALGDSWQSYGTPSTLWTTSGTAPSIGNGTLTGFYMQTGKFWAARISLVIGTTTSVGTGTWTFLSPVSSANFRSIWGKADCFNGPGTPLPRLISGIGNTSVVAQDMAGTRLAPTVPFTWSSTNRCDVIFGGESV